MVSEICVILCSISGFNIDFFCLEGACDTYLKNFTENITMFKKTFMSEGFNFVTDLVSVV